MHRIDRQPARIIIVLKVKTVEKQLSVRSKQVDLADTLTPAKMSNECG